MALGWAAAAMLAIVILAGCSDNVQPDAGASEPPEGRALERHDRASVTYRNPEPIPGSAPEEVTWRLAPFRVWNQFGAIVPAVVSQDPHGRAVALDRCGTPLWMHVVTPGPSNLDLTRFFPVGESVGPPEGWSGPGLEATIWGLQPSDLPAVAAADGAHIDGDSQRVVDRSIGYIHVARVEDRVLVRWNTSADFDEDSEAWSGAYEMAWDTGQLFPRSVSTRGTFGGPMLELVKWTNEGDTVYCPPDSPTVAGPMAAWTQWGPQADPPLGFSLRQMVDAARGSPFLLGLHAYAAKHPDYYLASASAKEMGPHGEGAWMLVFIAPGLHEGIVVLCDVTSGAEVPAFSCMCDGNFLDKHPAVDWDHPVLAATDWHAAFAIYQDLAGKPGAFEFRLQGVYESGAQGYGWGYSCPIPTTVIGGMTGDTTDTDRIAGRNIRAALKADNGEVVFQWDATRPGDMTLHGVPLESLFIKP